MVKKKRTRKSKNSPLNRRELCKQLEKMFDDLSFIEDVLIVCTTAGLHGDLSTEIEHIVRKSAANPLFGMRLKLHEIIVDLGGKTLMSEWRDATD